MKPYRTAFVALFAAATLAMPCAAQQPNLEHQVLLMDTCDECFAYLEFPASSEPRSYVTRTQAIEVPTSLADAGEFAGRLREQAAGLAATSQP